MSKDAANGIMVAKSPLVSKQNLINFDEPSAIIEPATIEQVRKEALIGLNKELEEETDPIKTKELKEMKLIIEAGEQEVIKLSKKDVNKINETTFCGRNQILASIAVIATASTTAAWTAGSMAQAPGADEVALSAVTAGMILGVGKIYGATVTTSSAATVIACMYGAQMGPKLATKLISWVPVIGNGANAASTAILHTATGLAVMGFCEMNAKAGRTPDFNDFKASDWDKYVAYGKQLKKENK